MRLKSFINEITEYSIEEIKSMIEDDCKPFLKEMKGSSKLVYRGTNKNIKYIEKLKPRLENRKPKDTSQDLHDELNKVFKKRFGWPVRNGIFTSGDEMDIASYGTTYMFFPIGKYKYVWSEDIKDLYDDIDDLGYNYSYDSTREFEEEQDKWSGKYGEDKEGHWEYNGKEVENDGFTESDIIYKLKKELDKFVYSKLKWIPDISLGVYTKDAEKEWDDDREYYIKAVINDNFIDKKLNNAIKSGHEIIFNCKEYYMVRRIFENEIQDYFK